MRISDWSSDVCSSDLIAVAEQTGLITPLTRWSLNTSAQHAALIRSTFKRPLAMAVNLSPRALAERGMVEQIMEALSLWEVDPQLLILEITETTVMHDPEASVPLLKRLRDCGLRIDRKSTRLNSSH